MSCDHLQLARIGPDAHEDHDVVAERAGIDLQPVAGDHPGILEPLHALAHGRRGHADPPGKFGGAETRVVDQRL